MTQIKARLLDIETKLDKNNHPYFVLSLQGLPNRYFYAFSANLPADTLSTLTNTPHSLISRLVLITYEELPNKENSRTFYKVKEIQVL